MIIYFKFKETIFNTLSLFRNSFLYVIDIMKVRSIIKNNHIKIRGDDSDISEKY